MKSLVVSSLLLSVQAAPQGVAEQVAVMECMDQITREVYNPGEEWTQTRIFEEGATKGMEGQFRCTCQDNGGITCRSLVIDKRLIYYAEVGIGLKSVLIQSNPQSNPPSI